jgi:hypothetical protein
MWTWATEGNAGAATRTRPNSGMILSTITLRSGLPSAMKSLCRQGSRASIGRNANDASKALGSLFLIQLSGTHASPEQRESVIRTLLESNDPAERELGLRALDAAISASNFGPVLNFGFGARSRDFGYWPASREAVVDWFGRFLKLAEDLACSSHIEVPRVRTVVADKFRGLWTGAAMYDDLERVCHSVSEKVFWAEGWMAVRETTY